MKEGFRQSMAWLHTWLGLSVGWVLYFIFVTGTLGYFYIEVDRWMRPELPLQGAQPAALEATRLADAYLRANAQGAGHWSVELPVGRQHNVLEVTWGEGSSLFGRASAHKVYSPEDAAFADPIMPRETQGLYGLYRMHWKLHYVPQQLGVLIVGVCTMIMLVGLVTGVVAHKKIFADFFTFRPSKGQRSWLDFHNLVSVLALPFFVMITYSGLIFYMETYVPAGIDTVYRGDTRAYYGDIEAVDMDVKAAGYAAPLLPLETFVKAAPEHWGGGHADHLIVQHPGDANARVVLLHAGDETVLRDVTEFLVFNAATGALIEKISAAETGPRGARSVLFGLHEGIFADTVLRWLYFASGLMGCAMIATGLVLWTTKRRVRQGHNPSHFGFRLVECLNIGTIAGLPAAIAVFLLANRLIPADVAVRQAWEFHALFIAWGVALAYAALQPVARAWTHELYAATGLCALVPLVNIFTTERHLGVTIPAGDWALAGVDLTLIGFTLFFAACAVVQKRQRT